MIDHPRCQPASPEAEASDGVADEATCAARLAVMLRSGRQSLLDSYRQALRRQGNVLGESPHWEECRWQAEAIIDDCVADLEGSWKRPDRQTLSASSGLGMSRAFNGVHPAESFHACTALFESFLDHVHRAVQTMPYTTADRLLKRTLYVYNSSVGLRVQSAMRGYDAFLLTKVRNANSDDRTRLARDIHDHLGSSLAMILRCLELHEAHEMQGPPGDRLRSAYAFLDEALYYTRTLVGNLRITTPRAGIEESLADFLADIQYDSPTTRVKVSGDEQWLTRDISGELFVILRECLRNALNHAGAECIEVAVDIAPHEINAYVVDDGKGFDASATLRSTVASGLSSVRERVKELGGQVHWTSIDGKGTKVVVHVPYTRSAEWAGLR